MNVQPIKTRRITPNVCTLTELLDEYVTDMPSGSVLAITSKVVSLCEGSVVPVQGTDKKTLIHNHSDLYADNSLSKWDFLFTVNNNTLIPNAGIDESNADDVYVLWPKNAQVTSNDVREYLVERFGHQDIGVIITDSTVRPMRRGVSGIALAFSGFKPLRSYIGQPDLFGRPFKVSQADIAGGLAATAVLMMGEGTESTPIVLMHDVTTAEYVHRNPTIEELASFQVPLEEDLFAPFLQKVDWQQGGSGK